MVAAAADVVIIMMDLSGHHSLMLFNIWIIHLPPLILVPLLPTAFCLIGFPVPHHQGDNTLATLSEYLNPQGGSDFV